MAIGGPNSVGSRAGGSECSVIHGENSIDFVVVFFISTTDEGSKKVSYVN